MKRGMAICISILLFFGIFSNGATAMEVNEKGGGQELPFSDIGNHWAKDNIIKAYETGLAEGFPGGEFRPDDVVRADQFVVMMLRAHSVTKDGKTQFDPAWFAQLEKERPGHLKAIKFAVSSEKFQFQNASSGYWAKPYIDFIYEIPFLLSYDEVFPKEYKVFQKQIKREEASYLLGAWISKVEDPYDGEYEALAIKNSGLKDFSQMKTTSGIYRATVLLSGLMNGYPNQYFYPQRYVTRAEALTMVLRLRDKTLRKPFKPSLKGKYYIENNDRIYLHSDKFKHEMYLKFLELAKKNVTKGHIFQQGGHAILIFKNKVDYEKFNYFSLVGDYESRPEDQLAVDVSYGNHRAVGFSFPVQSKFEVSEGYTNALYELLAGVGKGNELKKKLLSLIEEGNTKDFIFNGKKFTFMAATERYYLHLNY
ncbi:S-layer homology domain-containing protein [Paenibacillus sp. GCM10027627]|uniref:S-layer homology domain-containing protein n=1 Tax=unclassified Paenibacillus TaxID=185978 RepID=UPI003628BC30